MDNQEALDIVQALSEGVNPFSGEALVKESVCLNEAINKALSAAVAALENQIKTDERRANQPAKAGEPWGSKEEQIIINAHEAGESVPAIAKMQQRTTGSIRSRLEKLGKL